MAASSVGENAAVFALVVAVLVLVCGSNAAVRETLSVVVVRNLSVGTSAIEWRFRLGARRIRGARETV